MNCVRCGDQLILNLPLCLRCGEPIVAPEKSPRQKPETQSKDSPAQSNSQSTKEVGGNAESTSSKAAGQQADTQKHNEANSPLFPWEVIASLTFLCILLIWALSASNPSIPDPPVESDHSNNGVATISSASSAESVRETLDSSNQETKLNTALEDRKAKLVRDVQDKLTQHLFNPGPIDGIAGQKTRAAITDFQRENNLAISGSVDEELLVRLEGSLIKHQELNGGLTWTSEQESRYQELADLNDEFLEVEARAADPLAQYELGLRLVEKREYERAGSWFEMPAASGLLQAKNELGKLHSGSLLFASDPTYAYQLFMDAAAGGYLLAINNVGLCLEFGIGIEANPLAAVEWYRHAAIQGSPVAVLNLARLYKSGSSVDKDVNHAIALLEKVKKNDPSNADASLELGKIYMFNADGLRNTAKAKTWLADAADLRNVEAMELLGDLTCGTNAINPDCVEGYRWYHAAANEGNSNSMVMLGMMYAAGQGVEKDFTAAYFWFNQSASQGNALADILAGGFQAEGIGVEKDALTARDRFYRVYNSETATSFEKGFAMGMLGMLYFGENSSIRNVQEAAKAFEIAAEHGYSSAIMMLGIMYADGIVFEKDEAKAIMLLEKAASLGDQTTITLLATAYEEGEGFIQKDPEKAKFYRNQLADIHAQGWLHQAGSLFPSD